MNRQNKQTAAHFPQKGTWFLWGALLITSPLRAATEAPGGASQKSTYAINKLNHTEFQITSNDRSLRLELIPGDGSVIKINGNTFTFNLAKGRQHNELKLTQFLEEGFFKQSSESVFSKFSNFIFPTARAEDWIAETEGPRGLAQLILSLVYMNKESIKRKEEPSLAPSLKTKS